MSFAVITTEEDIITIGVEKCLSNSTIIEGRCLENIKKIYRSYGNGDNQQHLKATIRS